MFGASFVINRKKTAEDGISYFAEWYINFCGLLNAKSILVG